MAKLEVLEPKEVATANLIDFLLDQPQAQCDVIHSFGPGVYIREAHFPKNTFVVGHYHKYPHTNVFLKGKVFVFNDDGTTKVLTAPMMFAGEPGRKVGYMLEDVVWLNIYATEERDVEKLEEKLLDKTEVWEEHLKNLTPDMAKAQADRADYLEVLRECGLSQEAVDREVFDETVLRDMPDGSWPFQLGKSPIHGRGVFASSHIESGSVIGPARLNGMKTPLGRYTNHSQAPNAIMHKVPNGDIILVSIRDINGYSGGMVGEEITIDYRESLKLHREG